jgi:hypothetical protein
MAVQRDASWLNKPDTRSPKRWHVLVSDFNPACGTQMMPNYDGAIPASSVPMSSRCQRPGCKALWLLADHQAYNRDCA